MVKKLDEKTISQIAAGEVVERLASIVKELIENSIDANADDIKVLINNDIKGVRISVKDNGQGMNESDIRKSIDNHSTSKISGINDLTSINSYGFRGEALASIASISKMTIESKKSNSKLGTRIIFKGKKEIEKEMISMTDGTEIIIEDVFYNIPARKKFLKSFNTEFIHISKQFIYLCVSNPNVSFELQRNNKAIYKFNKSSNQKERIKQSIFKDLEESFIMINYEADVKIKGYIEIPNNMVKRGEQYIFVNNRYISDRILSVAVMRGYEGFVMKDQKPRYIIMIDINPREVDINVHPRKLEVRFRDLDYVFRLIQQIVSSSIEKRNIKKLNEYKFSSNDKTTNTKYAFNNNNKNSYHEPRDLNYYHRIDNQRIIENNYFRNFDQEAILPPSTDYKNKKYIQLFDSYILIVEKNSVIMIDQHAAAERITYERLENIQKENIKVLLLPIQLEIPKYKIELIIENKKILESYGILFQEIKTGIVVNSLPNFLEISDLKEFIEDILEELLDIKQNKNKSDIVRDHIRATLACHTSIRANKKLNEIEMDALVKDLYNCKNPMNCPHGRPTIWEINKIELEKKFKRV